MFSPWGVLLRMLEPPHCPQSCGPTPCGGLSNSTAGLFSGAAASKTGVPSGESVRGVSLIKRAPPQAVAPANNNSVKIVRAVFMLNHLSR